MKPLMLFLALAATATVAGQKNSPPKPRTRQVFVHVLDPSGAPVTDLAAADFELKENRVARPTATATVGGHPMRIALFVDTSDGSAPALTHMRAGLAAFLDAIPPDAEVLVVTTGRQVRVRQQPTTDRKKLKDLTNGLFADGGGTPLMDALLEVDDRFFKKTSDRWPVFVIVTADGSESSAQSSEKKFSEWMRDLPIRAISAHAFALKYRGGNLPDAIAGQVVQNAGGRFDFMNTSNALPEKMKALGEQLAGDAKAMASWYELTFETTGDGTAPVEISVARAGVRVNVSYRRATASSNRS